MVATVGHEVRQPLTSIGGFARQLTKETQLSEHAKRKLQIIVDEVARLERMLGELNDLSRPVEYTWNENRHGPGARRCPGGAWPLRSPTAEPT